MVCVHEDGSKYEAEFEHVPAYVGVLAYALKPRHESQVEEAVVGSARTGTLVIVEDHS